RAPGTSLPCELEADIGEVEADGDGAPPGAVTASWRGDGAAATVGGGGAGGSRGSATTGAGAGDGAGAGRSGSRTSVGGGTDTGGVSIPAVAGSAIGATSCRSIFAGAGALALRGLSLARFTCTRSRAPVSCRPASGRGAPCSGCTTSIGSARSTTSGAISSLGATMSPATASAVPCTNSDATTASTRPGIPSSLILGSMPRTLLEGHPESQEGVEARLPPSDDLLVALVGQILDPERQLQALHAPGASEQPIRAAGVDTKPSGQRPAEFRDEPAR